MTLIAARHHEKLTLAYEIRVHNLVGQGGDRCNAWCRGRRLLHCRERAGYPAAPCIRTLPRMPHGALQGGLCRVGRRTIIVGHARCQVIEGSEIGYPSAGARCEQRMEPGLPQAVPSGRSLHRGCDALVFHVAIYPDSTSSSTTSSLRAASFRARPSPDVGT